jgi:hypothetical protein
MTLGELIRERYELREEKRELARQDKNVTALMTINQDKIIEQLDAQSLDSTKVNGVNVTVGEQQMPSVTDWDAFYAWIKENDAFYMLERRPSAGPYREMLAMGEEIPGVGTFVKYSINMTKT